jgi:hypothetical protein
MHKILAAAFGLAMLASSQPASAGGLVEAGELEHARANARAGGPISEQDAELLERYGCLSGTDSWACRPHAAHRYYRSYGHHRHHRRHYQE